MCGIGGDKTARRCSNRVSNTRVSSWEGVWDIFKSDVDNKAFEQDCNR
jgi:hypothetical protein